MDWTVQGKEGDPGGTHGSTKGIACSIGGSSFRWPGLDYELEPDCVFFDAAEEDGGICSKDASLEEITKESRWGVRGGWTKFTGEQDYFEHYRAEELAPVKVMIIREIS